MVKTTNATKKVSNVTPAAKKPGRARMTFDAHVKATVEACGHFLSANVTMQHGFALWQSARQAVKAEVSQAARDIAPGRDWDRYKVQVRKGMVSAKMSRNKEHAAQTLRDIMKAVGLTGRGTNGKNKKGAPPKDDTGGAKEVSPQAMARQLHRVTAHCAAMQTLYAGKGTVTRASVLLHWGECAALANPDTSKRKPKVSKVRASETPAELSDTDAADMIRAALDGNGTIN